MSSVQPASGAFRSAVDADGPNNINLLDGVGFSNTAYASAYTPGATLIDAVELNPTLMQSWAILSVGFQAYLGLVADYVQGGGNIPLFGRLGRLIGGMALNGTPTFASIGYPPTGPVFPVPYQSSILPLPADPSLYATLWDPGSNPLPPQAPNIFDNPQLAPGSMLSVSGSVSLPVPRPVLTNQQVAVGLWLTPSLLGSPVNPSPRTSYAGLVVAFASYTVTYSNSPAQQPQ